jgi:phage-related protein
MAETPTMEVRARLTADSGQFIQGMENAVKATESLQRSASMAQKAISTFSVASAIGAGGLIKLGIESFMAAARVEELNYAMNAVGKSTGLGYEAIHQAAIGIKQMGIEYSVAQRSALMFAQNNLKLADASKLARVAQDLAVLSGKNSTEEFQLLTYAVMTQRTELFKSAGINGSVQQAYEKMAKSLGVSTQQLTAQQKVQAAMNLALEEGARVQGTYEEAMKSASKVLRSFTRINEEMKVAFGDVLLQGIGPIIVAFYHLEQRLLLAMEGSGAFHDVLTSLTAVIVHITSPITNFINGLNKYIEKFDKVNINTEKLAGTLNNILPILLAVGAGFATVGGSALFEMIPVLGKLLEFLAGGSGIPVALIVLATTSTNVREAFVNLGKALMPVINVVKSFAGVLLNVLSYAVGFVAKMINGLATVISATIEFIQRYASVFKTLAVAVGVLVLAYGAYKLTLVAVDAWQKVTEFGTRAMSIAMDIWAGICLVAEAATGGVTAAFEALAGVLEANPIGLVIGAVVALIGGLVVLYNTSDTARKFIEKAFNSVANTLGKAIGNVLEWFGHLLLSFADLIDTNHEFGRVIAKVFQFIYDTIITVITFVLKYYKMWIDVFVNLTDTHNDFGQIIANVFQFVYTTIIDVIKIVLQFIQHWLDAFVELFKGHSKFSEIVGKVFKFVAEIIAGAVNIVLQVFANILKGVATLVHYFGYFKDFIGDVWNIIWKVISTVAGWIGDAFSFIWDWIKKLFNWVKGLIADFIDLLKKPAGWIDSVLNLGWTETLNKVSDSLRGVKQTTEELGKTTVGPTDSKASVDAITSVGLALADATQSWGNYSTGVEGVISKFANQISKFGGSLVKKAYELDPIKGIDLLVEGAEKASGAIGDIIANLEVMKKIDVGTALTDGVHNAAQTASKVVGAVIDTLDTMKAIDVGTALTQGVSDVAKTAGTMLVGIGAGIKSFTSGNVLETIIDGTKDLVSSLKETMGFGDILADLQKKFKGSPAGKTTNDVTEPVTQINASADRLQKIKDSMKKGLDSIQSVIDNLAQASKDFANSLKDVIENFAGLKGVSLPDGFVPQAKSLIENMQEKLNKATQFSTQIAQLQALNLDAGALKQIIEAGPIQGAQLAASILSGGQEAVDQVSGLQKAIEFAGAAIGQQGAMAAGYPAMIKTAQEKYNSIASGNLSTSQYGSTINVQQGAIQIAVDTTHAKNQDEATAMIENALQKVFDTLGKELAAK